MTDATDQWTAAGSPGTWPAYPDGPEVPVIYADNLGPQLPNPPTSLGAGSSSLGFDGVSHLFDGYGVYENSAPNGGAVLLTVYAQDGATVIWQAWIAGRDGLKLDNGVFAQDGTNLWGRGGGHAGSDPNRYYQRWQFFGSGLLTAYARGPQVGGVGLAAPSGGPPPPPPPPGVVTEASIVAALTTAMGDHASPYFGALDHLVKNSAQVGAAAALILADVLTVGNFGATFRGSPDVERRLEDATWTDDEKIAQGSDVPVGENAAQLRQSEITNIEHA